MTSRLEHMANRLERAVRRDAAPGSETPSEDGIEAERIRLAVRARLLDETVAETKIDRFVVLGQIGVGGMGVVYAAYDRELDRKLAIKLVRPGPGAQREREQARLVREARALAQFSHPNVVAIYDVGVHDGRVFIAMELVAGQTLRAYAAGGRRSWRQLLHMYRQAGLGLAAAHAAGLVHRDFKPDNALVADDGRVRVLDFGLVQGEVMADGRTESDAEPRLDSPSSLTQTGKVVGTPAYMAPEQYRGVPADPRCDQFSFCASLWEALFGERAFRGTGALAVADAIRTGRVRSPTEPWRAPAWLQAVLLRGLALDPEARWPSMEALLDACARDPTPRRRRLIAGGLLAAGVVAAGGGRAVIHRARVEHCEARGAELLPVWSEARAQALWVAFAGTGLSYGSSTATRLVDALDQWGAGWAASREANCIAAEIDGTLDPTARLRRDDCLDEHADQLASLLREWEQPDRAVVNHAVRSAFALPRTDACQDDVHLAAGAAGLGPGTTREAVLHVRRQLEHARELGAAGRADDAMASATAARALAVALGEPALQAEADIRLGHEAWRIPDYEAASDLWERAYLAALSVGAEGLAFEAAALQVKVIGGRLRRYEEGMAWARHGEALLERLGEGEVWNAARLAETRGNLRRLAGDLAGALVDYQRVLALRVAYAGPDHPQVGDAWASLGALQAELGDEAGAEAAFANAENILFAAYGEDSLDVVPLLAGRCLRAFRRDALRQALVPCERALAIRQARQGLDHPEVATSLKNLAVVVSGLGEPSRARTMLEQALAIERTMPETNLHGMSQTLDNLGQIEAGLGDLPSAQAHLQEALDLRIRALPEGHPDIVASQGNVAEIRRMRAEPPATP